MNRALRAVGSIMRRFGVAFLTLFGHATSPRQRAALKSLSECRTPALGGHLYECQQCHQRCVALNSCRDRHCPTCRVSLAAKWVAAREAEILPVPYFFATFTLPHRLHPLTLANQALIYNFIFQAVSQALLSIAQDPTRLGAIIGLIAVLHTWGETMEYHPHLHVLIPGGGISSDGERWIRARSKYLLPTRVLSKRFRKTSPLTGIGPLPLCRTSPDHVALL